MSTMPPVSITDKVREYIADGLIKEAIDTLWGDLKRLSFNNPALGEIKNEVMLLRSRFKRLEREIIGQRMKYEDYDQQYNNISSSISKLLVQLDAEIGNLDQHIDRADSRVKVQMTLEIDFNTTTYEALQAVLNTIASKLNINPGELKITDKKKGSIILEMELTAELLIKLKSLAKMGVVEKLKDVRTLEDGWEWINEDNFVFVLDGVNLKYENLSNADLHSIDLSRANLEGAIMIGINLSDTDLNNAILCNANLRFSDLRGVDLRDADLRDADLRVSDLRSGQFRGADLRGVDLRGADLRGANFHNANLSNADLRRANLDGTNLSETKVEGAIFQISHLQDLRLMNVDISKAIFVDDDVTNVESLIEIE